VSTVSSALNHLSLTKEKEEPIFFPSPRINAAMAVKHNILYLYGGMVEDGDRQYTFCDFYSIGKLLCHQLPLRFY